MSKCVECGKDMETRHEDRVLDDLPEVTIADLAVEHCPACGATEEVWPEMEPMYRALAAAIITKPYRLTGAEVRVLRNVLGRHTRCEWKVETEDARPARAVGAE